MQTLYGKVGSNIFLHKKKKEKKEKEKIEKKKKERKRKDRKEKEKKETHRLHWKPDETLSRSFERQKTTIYFSFELLASFPLRSDLLLWGITSVLFSFRKK